MNNRTDEKNPLPRNKRTESENFSFVIWFSVDFLFRLHLHHDPLSSSYVLILTSFHSLQFFIYQIYTFDFTYTHTQTDPSAKKTHGRWERKSSLTWCHACLCVQWKFMFIYCWLHFHFSFAFVWTVQFIRLMCVVEPLWREQILCGWFCFELVLVLLLLLVDVDVDVDIGLEQFKEIVKNHGMTQKLLRNSNTSSCKSDVSIHSHSYTRDMRHTTRHDASCERVYVCRFVYVCLWACVWWTD